MVSNPYHEAACGQGGLARQEGREVISRAVYPLKYLIEVDNGEQMTLPAELWKIEHEEGNGA